MFQDREREIFDSFESFLLCVATTVVLMTQSRVHLERRSKKEKETRAGSTRRLPNEFVVRRRFSPCGPNDSPRSAFASVRLSTSHTCGYHAVFTCFSNRRAVPLTSSGTSRLLIRSKLSPLSRPITADGTTCASQADIVKAGLNGSGKCVRGGGTSVDPTATSVPVDPPHPPPFVPHARLAARTLSLV